ncbi:DNA helicase-2 / ATP-dependent DNA helicase PcrA [Nonomuraea jiangxiensis]|uniref:DNA helicase-2 / ATP-dependent DNA helicase PcrA n=2 Tax=Nonomuraea jiangxiensis TaxID=633440 RepID=A0A1G8RP50_9ACTN|nr:DNA helicase-2 / ATP-dependent DNA helicase PcrA [Nonomuraea jiangxiensis]
MACNVKEIRPYFEYIEEKSPFSTQHGSKGAEYPKVIVVPDDQEANYNLYSYEKLLGIRRLSDTDIRNVDSGKDSVLERTRRLLYVCVSRAIMSLAVVIFSNDIAGAKSAIEKLGIAAGAKILTEADIVV